MRTRNQLGFMTYFAAALSTVLIFFWVGCNSLSILKSDKLSTEQQKLVISGSSTVAPLAGEIARRFEQQNPGVRIDVQTGGSSRGIADARSGLADIGMASRDLNPTEQQDLTMHPVAVDGVCLIVNADNPVSALGREQVIGVFTGKIRNWKQLGGLDQPIVVVNKAAGRATLEIFLHHYDLAVDQLKSDVVIGDNQQGIKTVAHNVRAIGYVSIGAADYESKNGTQIKPLASDRVAPTLGNVASGRFPITRNLNLITAGQPHGLAREFIQFARSSNVQDIVESMYFVPAAQR